MSKTQFQMISIIGDGGWGTTLAIYLSKKGYPVTLWGAFPDYIVQMEKTRLNPEYLPGYKIPKSVILTSDLAQAVNFGDLIVLASPSEYINGVLDKLKQLNYHSKTFLSVIKGIHPETFQRMSEVIRQYLGNVPLAVLSGPTIAKETADGKVTTAVVACPNDQISKNVQHVFNSNSFRIYTNKDMVGVELGGSVKNVIAIACGICDGLGLGTNAKSAILTRGLAEIARLGIALGGKKETFYGLTCLGDLATTCFSPESRNRMVGEALGKGKSIKSILSSMHMVAEGVVTTKAVFRLSKQSKIPMPIVEQVYKIIFDNKNPKKALSDLMNRQVKSE